MFIKSQSNETIINLDRVCFIRKYNNYSDNIPYIEFYYSGIDKDSDLWRYDSIEERDEDFEKIEKLLNVVQFK